MSNKNIEKRTYRSDISSDQDNNRTVRGYAALYNSETELRPGIFERIAPGAFSQAIQVSDIRALLNHNPDHVLGRTKSGTLRVSEDAKGLAFEVDLPESRADVLESLKRGDIDQCSFAFTITDDGMDVERRMDGTKMITITKIDRVYDVTIATYPQYEDTEVSARTKHLLDEIEVRGTFTSIQKIESEQSEPDKPTQRNDNILKLVEASIIY